MSCHEHFSRNAIISDEFAPFQNSINLADAYARNPRKSPGFLKFAARGSEATKITQSFLVHVGRRPRYERKSAQPESCPAGATRKSDP